MVTAVHNLVTENWCYVWPTILCNYSVLLTMLKEKSRQKWPMFLIGQFELGYFLENFL